MTKNYKTDSSSYIVFLIKVPSLIHTKILMQRKLIIDMLGHHYLHSRPPDKLVYSQYRLFFSLFLVHGGHSVEGRNSLNNFNELARWVSSLAKMYEEICTFFPRSNEVGKLVHTGKERKNEKEGDNASLNSNGRMMCSDLLVYIFQEINYFLKGPLLPLKKVQKVVASGSGINKTVWV